MLSVVPGRAGSDHRRRESNGTQHPGMWTEHLLGVKGEHVLEQLCVSPSNTHPSIWEKSHHCLCSLISFVCPLFASDIPTALLNIFLVQRATVSGEALFSFAFSF